MALTRTLDGRMEKRIPIAIVVRLAQVQDQPANDAEAAYTDNISAHGACVISNRPWKLGQVMEVTSLKEQTALRGKVVRCQKQTDDRYAVGLAFRGRDVTWSAYRA
jgi:hypothetical protein